MGAGRRCPPRVRLPGFAGPAHQRDRPRNRAASGARPVGALDVGPVGSHFRPRRWHLRPVNLIDPMPCRTPRGFYSTAFRPHTIAVAAVVLRLTTPMTLTDLISRAACLHYRDQEP